MTILLISCCNFVYDYTEKLISIYFINSLSSKLLLNKNTKKRKRSYSNMSKVNISKISKSKIIESNIEHEKSNNYLITRNSSNKLNILTPNKKNYLNLNYIPKISRFQEHATYKNDFYSLNILKNISNKNNNIVNNDNNNNNK